MYRIMKNEDKNKNIIYCGGGTPDHKKKGFERIKK